MRLATRKGVIGTMVQGMGATSKPLGMMNRRTQRIGEEPEDAGTMRRVTSEVWSSKEKEWADSGWRPEGNGLAANVDDDEGSHKGWDVRNVDS